jgi:hypothetical protein
MIYVINLALLVLGTAGTLAAFGGETWRKTDEPLHRRITRRGWFALFCMVSTLSLGIAKEVRSNAASIEASKRQGDLENSLAKTTTELGDTRAKLAAIEPNLLQAMLMTAEGIRRESDFSVTEVHGQREIPLVSDRTRRQLVLYGGDQIDYSVFCSGTTGSFAGFPAGSQPKLLVLRLGETRYTLQEHGRQMVIGPVGREMPASLENPGGIDGCALKMLVESADKTRLTSQLEPLVRMIQDAKAASTTK